MLNVLIVDDSLLMRKKLKTHFSELGHTILGEAESGQDAIEKYTSIRPDVITMDITMPGMDGLEALKEIRRLDSDATVIMITSHGHEQTVLDALKNGAKGYILKPVTLEKLSSAIGEIFPEYMTDEPLE